MRYTETTLQLWTKPASDTEEQKIENTISMIKSAINSSNELKSLEIDIFVQGSYANNTNVRTNSDVDVCVMLRSTFYTEYPDGKDRNDYGFTEGNKSLKVRSNSYHVNADVVVALLLKDYKSIGSTDPNRYIEGTRFIARNSGACVTNYPKLHIANGRQKNNLTNYKYKYLVRIFKRIRNVMVDEGVTDGDKISSFLVECLVWNVPNSIITGYSTWTETVKQAIIYLYNAIKDGKHKEWGEVSERLYLFHYERKWTASEAQTFLYNMWNYLGY